MTFQPGSLCGSLISNVNGIGSSDSFARALRLLCQRRLPPYLVALQSTGDALRLLFSLVKLEEAKIPEVRVGSCRGFAVTKNIDRSKQRVMQDR